jgi:uncharacterized protein YndB with AHSA1/START domain
MKSDAGTIEFKFERLIPATPEEAFDGWLDHKVSGTPWNAAESFLLDARIDGLFYWHLKGTSHYGRFTAFERPGRMQHTWVSPNTLGFESLVTVSFQKRGDGTLMTLIHSGLPDHELARGHERGWGYFLSTFLEQFGTGSRKQYRWEEAHPPTGP